jgi:hypothetical protein
MRTGYISQFRLIEQATTALVEKLGVAKTIEFFASLGLGEGNYTKLRKKIFAGETVEHLYKKIKSK